MTQAIDLYKVYSKLSGFQIIEPTIEHEIPAKEFYDARFERPKSKPKAIRVLLVEDDIDARILMSYILHKVGISVTTAHDGEEGLAHALSALESGEQYDVILMDLQLPKLDGYSAAYSLRTKGYQAPILALTAKPIEEDLAAYKDAGCNAFMIKSEVHKKLLPFISQCLSH